MIMNDLDIDYEKEPIINPAACAKARAIRDRIYRTPVAMLKRGFVLGDFAINNGRSDTVSIMDDRHKSRGQLRI